MDRRIFFDHIRNDPFSGSMTPAQVSGINALLGTWEQRYLNQVTVPQLAYVLATVFHETGARMQPVREGFKRTDKEARAYVKRQGYPYAEPDPETGQVYYGRGHVQLTWARNYRLMGERMGIPLFRQPDLALDPVQSTCILFEGMVHGLFTGKALRDYFGPATANPMQARRIVNGMDRAPLVAGYYHAFRKALDAAEGAFVPVASPPERTTEAPRYPEDVKPLSQSRTMQAQGVTGAGTVGATASEAISDGLVQAQDATSQIAMYLDIAKWLFIAVVVAGIAWTIYARWDDHRKQRR